MALDKNHLLRAAGFEQQAADKTVLASRSRYLPHIFLDETASYSNMPTRTFMMKLDQGRFAQSDLQLDNLNNPVATGDFRTALTLEQLFFDVTVSRGHELVGKDEVAKRLAMERRRQEVAFQVYQAYLEVQKSRAVFKVTEQSLLDAKEHRRLADVRSTNGIGLVSDELRARTFVSEMEQQNITAYNNLLLAKLRLAQLIGIESTEGVDIRDEVTAFRVNLNIEEAENLARQNRQELQELGNSLEKADLAMGVAKGAYYPTLYGSASYQMNDQKIPFGSQNDGWLVAATLRWELFDGLRRHNDLAKMKLQKSAAEEYLANQRQEVSYQVREAFMRRSEAGKRLEVARHSVLDSEEVVRLVGKRFENSLATMVDLLDAQNAANRARAQLVENESNYALATARLYQTAGIFLQEVVK